MAYLIETVSNVADNNQNKQANSNWAPFPHNKLLVLFIKSTLHLTDQEKRQIPFECIEKTHYWTTQQNLIRLDISIL